MLKLLSILVLVAGFSFASCTKNATSEAPADEAVAEEVVEGADGAAVENNDAAVQDDTDEDSEEEGHEGHDH
jgi:hypothetical protein